MRLSILLRSAALIALGTSVPLAARPADTGTAKARYGAFGIDLTAEDKAVKPGDDFWTFANGAWAKRTEIPADKSAVGYANILSDEAEVNVRAILDDMAANPAQYGASGKQVGDFYATWMDEAGVEAKGTAPLKPYLAKIAAVKDVAGADLVRDDRL